MKSKMSGNLRRLVLFSIVVLLLCGCSPFSAQAAKVKKYTLVLGQTKQLKKRKKAVWRSTRKSVATVSSKGLVKARKKGKATITAKVGKKKYLYKITVEDPSFNVKSVTLKAGKTKTLKLRGTSKKFKFVSSNPSVVKVKRKSKNKVVITAVKDGKAVITASYKGRKRTCSVKVLKAPEKKEPAKKEPSKKKTPETEPEKEDPPKKDPSKKKTPETEPEEEEKTFDLVYDGKVIQTLTYEKSDVAKYVSSISKYGQSAPLYLNVNGGDGLESIFAQKNNGNVNVPDVKLSDEAREGTIAKACLWARAVCDSEFHGYDDGQVHEIDCWGIAKSNAPGTGDYCCFSLAECAYYFAGVNVLGECLGNPEEAIYPPYSTMLFGHGGISIWGDTKPRAVTPRGSKHIFPKTGFESIGKQKKDFIYKPGDIAVSFFGSQQHMELVITEGTAQTCEVAEAYGPGKGGRKGGDQSGYELTVKRGFYKASKIAYVYRFTGEGVVLNTVGLKG